MTDSERVSLADAVKAGIISCNLEAARKRAQRDPMHPQPVGRNRATYLYDMAELHAYDTSHGTHPKQTRLESWKPIPGFSGYQASAAGRVRSVDRTHADGRSYRGQVLAVRKSNRGYLLVNLCDDAGKWQTRSAHTLILLAHVGPPPPGQVTRHLNDNPEDNRLENLAYGTAVENEQDKFANGTREPAAPKPPRLCVRCNQPVDKGGRRCHACVVEIGEEAARLLEADVTLEDVGHKLDYPHLSGLHALARKYGGYGRRTPVPEAPAPLPSQTVSASGPRPFATLRHRLRRGRR